MVELKPKELKIFELIKRNPGLSKYQLWKLSGYYSYSSVWNIIENLILRDLVKEEINVKNDSKLTKVITLK